LNLSASHWPPFVAITEVFATLARPTISVDTIPLVDGSSTRLVDVFGLPAVPVMSAVNARPTAGVMPAGTPSNRQLAAVVVPKTVIT
jgi:hypothetical protein